MSNRKPTGEKWESFVERQIQAAKEEGEFDHLPGFGKPCAAMDEPLTPDDWLKKKLKRERLSVLPPSLQIKCDLEKTLRRIDRLTVEVDVRRELESLNERIRAANRAALWGPPSTVMELDVSEYIKRWRARS